MQLVLDANILFAALIKDSTTHEIIISELAEFFTPEFILEEFYTHKKEILDKTKRTPEEFERVFEDLKERIIVIPKEEYQTFLESAANISPDPKDVPYLALALKFKIPIWSNDRKLKENQSYIKVYSTKDLIG